MHEQQIDEKTNVGFFIRWNFTL